MASKKSEAIDYSLLIKAWEDKFPLRNVIETIKNIPTKAKRRDYAKNFYFANVIRGTNLIIDSALVFMYYPISTNKKISKVTLIGAWDNWKTHLELRKVWDTDLWIGIYPISLFKQESFHYLFIINDIYEKDHAVTWLENAYHNKPHSIRYVNPKFSLGSYPKMYSHNLKNHRSIYIYYPPNFTMQRSTPYPVVYVMDGQENISRGNLPEIFNNAILSKVLPPFLAVFVPHAGSRRNLEYTPYYSNSRINLFHKYFVEEVVSKIEGMLPVDRNANTRILIGQSFGGTIVATLAAKYRTLFHRVIAQSGVYIFGHHSIRHLYESSTPNDAVFYLDSVQNKSESGQHMFFTKILQHHKIKYKHNPTSAHHSYEEWKKNIVTGLIYLWSV